MKREERNEINYIKRYEKQFDLGYGTTLTIRTDGGSEYKHALHDLYTGWGFHPASVQVDRTMYDDKERIIYIFSRTWIDDEGRERSWTELFTPEERAHFAAALD
jgi:hypothetical protein